MARIKFASYLDTMNGRMGDAVFYSCNGRHYARVMVKPRNPNTAAQVLVRRTFGDAVRAWQALDHDSKRKFIRKGRMRRINGYNLFISEYMKERMPAIRSVNSDREFKEYSKPVVPLLLRSTSVPTPLPAGYSHNSPPPGMVRDKIPA